MELIGCNNYFTKADLIEETVQLEFMELVKIKETVTCISTIYMKGMIKVNASFVLVCCEEE